jgi:hypothetical protein
MLKIKDNVDLKELEKYGFEENGDDFYREITGNFVISYPYGVITVSKNTREINVLYHLIDGINAVLLDNVAILPPPIGLYDLIKADLVEKID